MRKRSLLGICILLAGVALIALSINNMYTLLFISDMTRQSDIPMYAKLVLFPALLGVLFMVDGTVISGLNIPFSAILYAIGNAFWVYASIQVRDLLSIPITQVPPYQETTLHFILAVSFMIGGTVSNHVLEVWWSR